MKTRTKSRLNKNLEKKTKKRLFWSIVGIFLILFFLVKFGIPALINFSLFLASGKDQELAKQTQNNQLILLTPTLNQEFAATNSATITVNGNAAAKEKIELFVNNSLAATTDTKDDGSFHFSDVKLTPGGNIIKAKAKVNNKESDFSNILSVTYRNNPPSLSVDSPFDGQTFSGSNQQDITVKGKTDADVKVTVNGFWAISDDNGNYSYSMHLQNGDNQIKIVAVDSAGNQAEKDITIHFNQ